MTFSTISTFTLRDKADTLQLSSVYDSRARRRSSSRSSSGTAPKSRARCTSSVCPLPYSALSTPKRPLDESKFSTSLQSKVLNNILIQDVVLSLVSQKDINPALFLVSKNFAKTLVARFYQSLDMSANRFAKFVDASDRYDSILANPKNTDLQVCRRH